MKELIGRKINRIFLNEDYLKFYTDTGVLIYTVEGHCCSHSVFYDFYGVKNLLKNKKVIDVKEIDLNPNDITDVRGEWAGQKDKKGEHEDIKVYGYQITTKNKKFGEVTSVVSFRNYSNGYYGGRLNNPSTEDVSVLPEIFDDVVDTFKLM